MICKVIVSGKRNPLIGTYVPNSTLEHLPELEEAMTRFRDQDPIVLGYLNTDIGQSHNHISQQVVDLMIEFEMADLLHHFRY